MSRPSRSQRERQRRQQRAERRQQRDGAGEQKAGPSSADPIYGTTARVIDASLRWHVARTLPRMGGRALEALKAIEVATFLPRASEVVVRRGRRVVRRTPLVMRTVFIGVRDAAHLAQVYDRPGIAEIVSTVEPDAGGTGNIAGFVHKPARIEPAALQRFVNALADGEIVQPIGIKVGDDVVVMTGPFASFPAVVEQILPGDRVKVAVSIFGRPSVVELGIADVQKA